MSRRRNMRMAMLGSILFVFSVWMVWLSAWSWFEILVIFLLFAVYLILDRGLYVLRKARVRSDLDLQGAITLYSILSPTRPLPEMGGFALTASKCATLMRLILHEKPVEIVELGSGVSTIVMAYCLRKIGHGRIQSFEHDSVFVEQTRKMLRQHGLDDIATVVYAPLVPQDNVNGRLWYDVSKLGVTSPIDLLFVDGPPRRSAQLARYPALDFFAEKLKPGSWVVLDDTDRKDEGLIAKMWSKCYENLKEDWLYSREQMFVGKLTEGEKV